MILWWTPSDERERPRLVTVHEVIKEGGVAIWVIVKEYGLPLPGMAKVCLHELERIKDAAVQKHGSDQEAVAVSDAI